MAIKIGICDDDIEDIKALRKALYQYDPSMQIIEYQEGEELIEDWLENKNFFDIMFLDIYMPGINGIEIARKIRQKDTKIIFVTSSKEHYPDAYGVFAFNYLLKPIKSENLFHVLDQALVDINNERRQQITFSYKSINYRIYCRDILYLESRDKLLFFHMKDKTILQCYAKMDDLLIQLPKDLFIRCHQSFTVNIFHVSEMGENYFRIDPAVINISKKYQKSAKDKYYKYLFDHMNRGI